MAKSNNIQDVQVVPSTLSNWCQVARGGITSAAADIRLKRKETALEQIRQAHLALQEIERIAEAL